MMNLFKEQPKAFRMIFMLELWERFGFYTVQGILTLYFIRHLGYSHVESYYTFGAFSALVYGMVVIGGYLGDRVLGTKRTMVLGLVVLSLGYFALALADKHQVFFALGLICIGNGLFKANPSNLLAKCYEKNDSRLHGGFTLYYMAINAGSMIALLIGPAVSSTYGYSYAYFLSAIGLIIGLVNYWYQRQCVADVNTFADLRTISILQWAIVILSIYLLTEAAAYLLQHVVLAESLLWTTTFFVFVFYVWLMKRESRETFKKMFVALALMIEAVIFFTLYQQMPTSINLFAVNNINPTILGITFDPQSFQALNPIWIVIMSPVMAILYKRCFQKGIKFTIPYKFALGMSMCGISFLVLYFSRFFYVGNGIVSPWWLVSSYLFQSVGELLVSALGVAMVAELVPAANAGFVMGMWFLTSAVAGFLGANVASLTALEETVKPGVQSLFIYTNVFACIGLVTLGISVLMWLLSPRLSRYISDSQNPSETKLESAEYSATYIPSH